jgi:hypothetical protein
MLAYRKVSLPKKTYSPPPLPYHLFAEIERNNFTLNEERITYDQALHKLTLGVRVLSNYDVKEGGLLEKQARPQLDGNEESKATIDADLRDTVEDLKKRIAKEFANGSYFYFSYFYFLKRGTGLLKK